MYTDRHTDNRQTDTHTHTHTHMHTKTSARKATDAPFSLSRGFCVTDAVELHIFLPFDLSCELCAKYITYSGQMKANGNRSTTN
jgi:hypothetical protein